MPLHELQDLPIVYIHDKLTGEVFHASEAISYLPQDLKLYRTTISLKWYCEVANQINVLPTGPLIDVVLQSLPLKVLEISTPKPLRTLNPKKEVVLERVQGHKAGKVYHKGVNFLLPRRSTNSLQSEIDEIGHLMAEVTLKFMDGMTDMEIGS